MSNLENTGRYFISSNKVSKNFADIQKDLDEHIEYLYDRADSLIKNDQIVCDQSFPSCIFSYEPLINNNTHILLIGGMGPLAGAYGMKEGLEMFKEQYSIGLFQACFIPKREHNQEVVNKLLDALNIAVQNSPCNKKIELIVLCNSAHNFIDDSLNLFFKKDLSKKEKINLNSLKTSVEKNLHLFKDKNSVVLKTGFSCDTGLYDICKTLPSLTKIRELSKYQKYLNKAIEGVKEFNEESVIKNGTKLFNALKKSHIQSILLGCTEIPIIVNILKNKGSNEIKNYLGTIQLIDPVKLTLEEIKNKKRKNGNYT